MRTSPRSLGSLLLVVLLAGANLGCLKKMLFEGQVASTRKGSAAVNTLSDFEVARAAAFAGLSQFEGMHLLGPENQDALFLLAKGWAGAGFGFIEDDMEVAADRYGEDSDLYEYHKARAVAAYARAIHYGTTLLELRHPGFKPATKNMDTMKAWMQLFDDPELDTEYLFWTGQAWMSRVNLLKDRPEVVGELFVGVAMLERAVELDEKYLYGSGHVLLGSYHARSAMAELDESKKHFERALELSGGGALMAKLQFAVKYYCTKVDQENYVRLLTEVIEAGDVLPQQRLQNTIAKRKARRYLGKQRINECGF
ncbi:MAG: hypothetical protein HY744_14705 [Deltaproteobacteria bacterium]|nr:hypothetical protein [Deltaproteobacteria bacterium]